jgi:hypothetical protein
MSVVRLSSRRINAELDNLLAQRWGPAQWRRVDDAEELPWRLRQLAVDLPRGTWRAYADGESVALAAGQVAENAGLAVRFYDASAQQCAAGVWHLDSAGRWRLREVID